MKRRMYVVLAMLALVPTLASAQRSRGGSSGGDAGGGSSSGARRGGGASFKMPTRGDLEDMNPASFLIDKRKKLQLTDEQVTALKAVEGQIKERYKVNLAVYDSLRRNAKPMQGIDKGAAPSPAEQAEMQKAMQGLQLALGNIRSQRQTDVEAALGAIADAAAKARATELMKEQDEEFAKLMPGGGGRDR